MRAADILILTALAVIALIALALLLAGGRLLARADRAGAADSPAIDRPLDLLDRQWHIERALYRHHRWTGLLIIAASGFFLWQAFTLGPVDYWHGPAAWNSFWWLLIAGNIANLAIGLVVTVRPSWLKPLETAANRWYPVDSRYLHRVLARNPRLRGALLLLGAGAALVGAGLLLAERVALIT